MDSFIGMGFSTELVAAAIKENGEDNSHLILETLLKQSACSSASSSNSKVVDHFVGMGFSEKMVLKAIQENGEENTESLLETLLSCKEISPPLSDDEEKKLLYLVSMGYPSEDAAEALKRCGPDANLEVLTDCLFAAHMARADDTLDIEDQKNVLQPKSQNSSDDKKRKYDHDMLQNKKLTRRRPDSLSKGEDEAIHIPKPMIGFGVPTEARINISRKLREAAIGPPYFYFENVALAPKGVWNTISRFLYDVEPEFVDSKYLCAAARKRGYVHNLPIENRFPLIPIPPVTIQDALPLTRRWWPKWDPRTKLNCLHTSIASAKLTDRIRKALQEFEGDPPLSVQKYVLEECKRYNLVWVGKNKAAPLEPDEVEMLLGFPKNHTRGGGISKTDRYKSLGNSFQVDTVAYHLSVLKSMYPDGINVLSLFSGIGGAEVSLHRLGIRLKTVVSVEISEVNRNIVRSWWEQTNQKGNLIHFPDVQELHDNELEDLMSKFGAFDLVIGGSPCNNLTGSNRFHRNGLEGKESALFYEFYRILDLLMSIPRRT